MPYLAISLALQEDYTGTPHFLRLSPKEISPEEISFTKLSLAIEEEFSFPDMTVR